MNLAMFLVGDVAFEDLGEADAERVEPGDKNVVQEEQKGLHISKSDAVADPYAVMVHPEYTPLALGAVMRPRRLHTLTELARVDELVSDELDFMVVKGATRADFDKFFSIGFGVCDKVRGFLIGTHTHHMMAAGWRIFSEILSLMSFKHLLSLKSVRVYRSAGFFLSQLIKHCLWQGT